MQGRLWSDWEESWEFPDYKGSETSVFEVNWIKKKRYVPKYRSNDLDGWGTLSELKKIGYDVEYYIAISRAIEAVEGQQRPG